MPQPPKLSAEQLNAARSEVERGASSKRAIAKRLGVDPATLRRALSKAAPKKTRRRAEFAGTTSVKAPQSAQPIGSWTLAKIRSARDDQMKGRFKQPVRLAEAMRTDDAMFVAYHNRLAPHNAIASELEPSDDSTRAHAVQRRALASVFLSRTTLEGVNGTLANHGVAVLKIDQEPAGDGTRVDFRVEEWPLEHVWWDASREQLMTSVRNGFPVSVVHGDGQWVVVRKFDALPWTQEACLLPGAMLWAGHAYGLADWAQSTKSHGQAKMAANLPEMYALQEPAEGGSASDEMVLTPEAEGVLQTLNDMVSGEAGAGIFPAGVKVDFLANGSTAWQVFKEFILDRKQSAARIYNGTDATMGANGGAPGVDISVLFGVASTKVQGDLEAIMQAVNSGVYQPWAAINYGDSRYAPRLKYLIPDPDAARQIEEEMKRRDSLALMIKAYKEAGFIVDQDAVDRMAAICRVSPVPQLASGDTKAAPLKRVALAGRNFDESKVTRDGDGKFGSGPGQPNKSKPSGGGGEGNGPKGDGGSGEGADPAEPKDRKAVAEKRLGQAREQHAKAVEDHAATQQRFEKAKADGLAKLDERAQHRAEISKQAKAKADEIDAEQTSLEREQTKLDREAKKAGLSEDGVDDDKHPEHSHPVNVRRREVAQRLGELEDTPVDDLRREARANAKPDKRLAKARAALEAGDLDRFEELESDNPGKPETEFLDSVGVEYDVRKAYRQEHGFGRESEDRDVAELVDRELARREAARPDTSVSVSPVLGTPEQRKIAENRARERWVKSGFQGEPPAEDLERMTEAQMEKMRRANELTFHHDNDLLPAAVARDKAAAKVQRAERAVRVHQREVKRVGGKIDADGDGRTGQAEEKDDRRPLALAGRNFDEAKITRADDGKFGSGPGSTTRAPGGSADAKGARSALDNLGDIDRGITAEAKTQEAQSASAMAAAKSRADKARADYAGALKSAGFKNTPPELEEYGNALASARGAGAGPRAKARLAAAEAASAGVRAKLGETGMAKFQANRTADLELDAAATDLAQARLVLRGAPKREKAISDLQAAVSAGDRAATRRAHARVAALYEDTPHTFNARLDALVGADPDSLIDGDGDGRTGQAEEKDDKKKA